MVEFLTKSRARNIFYRGPIFFGVAFAGMRAKMPDVSGQHSSLVINPSGSLGPTTQRSSVPLD